MTNKTENSLVGIILPDTQNRFRLNEKYTRFVSLTKLALLAAAAALSMLVIAWSMTGSEDPIIRLPLSNLQSKDDLNQGMTNGKFIGQDSNNQPYIITAHFAQPVSGNPSNIALQTLQADITMENGTWLTLISPDGFFERNENKLILPNSVYMYADNGMELNTKSVELDLVHGIVSGNEELTVNSSFGRLSAYSFRFMKNERLLTFGGRVKMVVQAKRIQ